MDQLSHPDQPGRMSRKDRKDMKGRKDRKGRKSGTTAGATAGAAATGSSSRTAPPGAQQAGARQIGSALGRGWLIVLLFALLGGGLGAGAVYAMPQRTIGTTTVLVDIPVQATDIEALVRTVETLILSQAVLTDLSAQPGVELSPQALEDAMEVERATGSAVIEVSVIDTSEDRVRAVAEQVVPVLEERLADIEVAVSTEDTATDEPETTTTEQPGGSTVPLSVTTFGTEPYVRDYSWSLIPTVALGVLGGLLVGGLIVVVRALRRLPA